MSARELNPAHGLGAEPRSGKIFGIPLGDLGLFSSLLIAFAFGFLVFFLTCFVAIFGLLFYNEAGHHTVDMAYSYRYVAFPAGLIALAVALVVLLGFWVRRKLSGEPADR
jgi:TRAP-type C4-dicarboxylate transport system permease small subunit